MMTARIIHFPAPRRVIHRYRAAATHGERAPAGHLLPASGEASPAPSRAGLAAVDTAPESPAARAGRILETACRVWLIAFGLLLVAANIPRLF